MQSLVSISSSSTRHGLPEILTCEMNELCLHLFHFSLNLVSDPCSLEACDHIFCRYVFTFCLYFRGIHILLKNIELNY